jgi:outer membrane biosynthesis protein TonB
MMPLRLKTVLLFLAPVLAVISGCSQKKPVLVVPRERPVAAVPTPTPTPQAQESSASPTPQPTPEATPSVPEQAQATPARKKHHIGKPSPSVKANPDVVAQANPKKSDVPPEAKNAEPKATPGLIAPAISASDAVRDQTAAEQLLRNTETNLTSIGKRQLSSDEDAVVSQIKNFITQSRQALKDNDPARARNLALKANLLSNDLTKSR